MCVLLAGHLHQKYQISNHEDSLSGQHRGNGVCEFVEGAEDPEWQAVIGPELHPHIYEYMPQRLRVKIKFGMRFVLYE